MQKLSCSTVWREGGGCGTRYGIIIIIRAASLKSGKGSKGERVRKREGAASKVAVNNCQNYLRMLCSESLPAWQGQGEGRRCRSSAKTKAAATKAKATAAAMHASIVVVAAASNVALIRSIKGATTTVKQSVCSAPLTLSACKL